MEMVTGCIQLGGGVQDRWMPVALSGLCQITFRLSFPFFHEIDLEMLFGFRGSSPFKCPLLLQSAFPLATKRVRLGF